MFPLIVPASTLSEFLFQAPEFIGDPFQSDTGYVTNTTTQRDAGILVQSDCVSRKHKRNAGIAASYLLLQVTCIQSVEASMLKTHSSIHLFMTFQIRLTPHVQEDVCMRQSALTAAAITTLRNDILSQPLMLLTGVDILGNASSALGHMSKGVAALSMDKKFIRSRQKQVVALHDLLRLELLGVSSCKSVSC